MRRLWKVTVPGAAIVLPVPLGGVWLVQRGSAPSPTTHTYYVAADEVEWDYAPSAKNLITGEPFGRMENRFVRSGPDRIGKIYKKSLYREYTDASFRTLKPRSQDWEHLGFLGPLLRASVGDTIVVVFRNNTRFPASVHPHGVLYDKDSEGAASADGTGDADKADDAVTGGTHTYVWPVPERAGPAMRTQARSSGCTIRT